MRADHAPGHTVTESCPIRCLGLAQATEDALIVHWRADGQYAPNVRDVLQLRAGPGLLRVFGIGYGRSGEIERRLKAVGLEVTA